MWCSTTPLAVARFRESNPAAMGILTVRVRAVAEKGEANRAVEAVVAGWLGVPKSSVAVTAGGRSRLKTVLVTGEPARLAARVDLYVSKLQ